MSINNSIIVQPDTYQCLERKPRIDQESGLSSKGRNITPALDDFEFNT